MWEALGSRLFDDNLDCFKQCILTVLKERDPKFELPAAKRFASSIYGKESKYSPDLRKGMVDTSGESKRDLAEKWRLRAEQVENTGYHRFTSTLRRVADYYESEAVRVVSEHDDDMRLISGE